MLIPLVNRFLNDTAFMLESTARLILDFAVNPVMGEHPAMAEMRKALTSKSQVVGGIAHIPVTGLLCYAPHPIEMAFLGMEDSRNIVKMVNDARLDSKVEGIQLDVDSPGGFYVGGPEIADAVASANKVKPTVAHIGGTGGSLAYWIASQAGQVISNRSAMVGSIGAYQVHMDSSRLSDNMGIKVEVFKNKDGDFKAVGIPGTSLDEKQRSHIQSKVESQFKVFKNAVLAGRPTTPPEAMRGQVFTGDEAKAMGLIDEIGSADYAHMRVKRLL